MGIEAAVPRYLEVFVPFIATLVCAHYILRGGALTQGDLFLRPRFPESQLLMTLLVVGFTGFSKVGRTFAPFARWLERIA